MRELALLVCGLSLVAAIAAAAQGPLAAPGLAGPKNPIEPTASVPVAPFPEISVPTMEHPLSPIGAPGDAGAADGGAADGGSAEMAPVVPTSLTRAALCSELRQSAKEASPERGKLEEERKALAADRALLEKQAADLERARAALREETKDLKMLLDAGGLPMLLPPVVETTQARSATASRAFGASGSAKKTKTPLDVVAQTIRAMKPEQAAAMVERMDRSITIELLRRLKPAEAGAVLEKLKPELAAQIITAMTVRAGRRESPQ